MIMKNPEFKTSFMDFFDVILGFICLPYVVLKSSDKKLEEWIPEGDYEYLPKNI